MIPEYFKVLITDESLHSIVSTKVKSTNLVEEPQPSLESALHYSIYYINKVIFHLNTLAVITLMNSEHFQNNLKLMSEQILNKVALS